MEEPAKGSAPAEEPRGPVPLGTKVVVIVFALLGPAVVAFGLWARTQLGNAPQAAVLATGWGGAGAIALDADAVYGATDGGIRVIPKRGGSDSALVARDASGEPASVAVDGTHVYWTAAATETSRSALLKVDKRGGAPEVVAVVRAPSEANPRELALDERSVYWAACGGAVLRVEKSGGAPEVLASGGKCPSSLAVDEAHVYWAEEDAVKRAPKAGGEPTVLFTGADLKGPLRVAGDRLYFNRKGPTWMPKAGGSPELLTTDGEGVVVGADGTHVYYVHASGRGDELLLSRAKPEGTGIELISKVDWGLHGLGADESGVYFTTARGELQALRR